MAITRSTGLYTGIGAYFCENGYEGLTKELDDTVKREAALLTTTFKRDVEIRFNSDRESGGAWLKNSLKGFTGNCQVGLGAGLRPIEIDFPSSCRECTAYDWGHCPFIFKSDACLIRRNARHTPKEIYYATYVSENGLKDPSLCNSGEKDSRYCYLLHQSIDEALAWLVANVDREKIYG